MQKKAQADLKKSVIHGIMGIVLFGIPILLNMGGAWKELTIGGVLTLLYNFARKSYFTV